MWGLFIQLGNKKRKEKETESNPWKNFRAHQSVSTTM